LEKEINLQLTLDAEDVDEEHIMLRRNIVQRVVLEEVVECVNTIGSRLIIGDIAKQI